MKQAPRKCKRACNLASNIGSLIGRWMYQTETDMNDTMQYTTLQTQTTHHVSFNLCDVTTLSSSLSQNSDTCSRMRQFPTLPIGIPVPPKLSGGKWTFHFCDPTTPPPQLPPFGKSGPGSCLSTLAMRPQEFYFCSRSFLGDMSSFYFL
jgi:hypothetical protein